MKIDLCPAHAPGDDKEATEWVGARKYCYAHAVVFRGHDARFGVFDAMDTKSYVKRVLKEARAQSCDLHRSPDGKRDA